MCHLLFEIAVEMLRRIELGRVGRKVVNGDQLGMRLDSSVDRFRFVHI